MPAGGAVARRAARRFRPLENFVPVAFHVNDWGRLGWPDRFASREATQCEYAHADVWVTRRGDLAPLQATGGWLAP